MAGIVFFSTRQIDILDDFYRRRIGCTLWLEQGGCRIYRHGNFLLGFCQRNRIDTEGIITFFFPTDDDVNRMYQQLKNEAEAAPVYSPRYVIYHFFASDPEGRKVEFQHFRGTINYDFKET